MMAKLSLLCLSSILPALICWASSADLPTNYEYFTEGGIVAGLNADQRYFKLNEKEITIFSGAFHYFRVHSSQWRDRLRKMRAAGLNTIETYVSWNLHEYHSGAFDFGHGGSDFEEFLDIAEFIKIAQEEDLFVLVRAGPYICSEWEFGAPLRDTYINVRDWRKGIAIINGFVLGRIFAIGPQQAMYLPAGLLQEGENDLIIFEHFTAPEYVKFSKNAIWGKGTYVN
ncbi:hypothetical protein HUJ05_011622 [Dendroctonus ponderosae]|nr:hypothetical protein HUJ05_011622 [Dendroctonus ponderosae]